MPLSINSFSGSSHSVADSIVIQWIIQLSFDGIPREICGAKRNKHFNGVIHGHSLCSWIGYARKPEEGRPETGRSDERWVMRGMNQKSEIIKQQAVEKRCSRLVSAEIKKTPLRDPKPETGKSLSVWQGVWLFDRWIWQKYAWQRACPPTGGFDKSLAAGRRVWRKIRLTKSSTDCQSFVRWIYYILWIRINC